MSGVTLHRDIDGSEPVRATPISEIAGAHEQQASWPWRLATGTLACPRCDAPVHLGGRAVPLVQALNCPFCSHTAALRDFLSLATPTRPARVEIRMLPRARRALS